MGQEKDAQQEQLQNHVSGQSNKPMSAPAHALSIDDVLSELKADVEVGLSPDEAKRRLEEHGRNEFGEQEGVQPLKILIGQIANALTLVSLTLRASYRLLFLYFLFASGEDGQRPPPARQSLPLHPKNSHPTHGLAAPAKPCMTERLPRRRRRVPPPCSMTAAVYFLAENKVVGGGCRRAGSLAS